MEDNVEHKLTIKSPIILFLVGSVFAGLAETLMAFSFPVIIERSVNSNEILGAILAIGSIIGLIFDYFFPSLFRKHSWKSLLIISLILSMLFPILTFLGESFSPILIFALASILWSIYYELWSFSSQSYVSTEHQKDKYLKIWSVTGTMYEILAVVGPILAAYLLTKTNIFFVCVVIFLELIALIITLLIKSKKHIPQHELEGENATKSLIDEIKYWGLLGRKTLPVIIGSFLISFISTSFWTFGAIFAQSLAKGTNFDWIMIVAYSLPSVLGGIVMSKLNIKRRKKRISQIFLLITGVLFSLFYFTRFSLPATVILVGFISITVMVSWLLISSVYSDLQKRLGRFIHHLQGVGNATKSLAFIFAPLVMGTLADKFGFSISFAILGVVIVISSLLLLILTPRKIRLPQKEISTIETTES
jgi:MFS family permease